MNKSEFKQLIRECIEECLVENLSPEEYNNPLYVEYHSQRSGETPFTLAGEKFEYVNAKYPNGKIDIGVYAFRGDVCYGYNAFRQRYGIKEGKKFNPPKIRKGSGTDLQGSMNLTTRIHGQGKQGKKPKYDRKRDQSWKKNIDEKSGKVN